MATTAAETAPSDARRAPSTGGPGSDPSSHADDASSDPPADAATTFEDLPHDLFGEEQPDDRPSAAPPTRPEPASRAPRAAAPSPRVKGDGSDDGTDSDGGDDGDGGDGDPIEIVQTLFPGRIVAIEAPAERDPDGDDPHASPADAADGGSDRSSDDESAREEASGPGKTDDFASGTNG